MSQDKITDTIYCPICGKIIEKKIRPSSRYGKALKNERTCSDCISEYAEENNVSEEAAKRRLTIR